MHQKQPPASMAISLFLRSFELLSLLTDCFEALLIFLGIKVKRIKIPKNIKLAVMVNASQLITGGN